MIKGKQFLEDDDGQLHFNFPGTEAHLDRERRRRTFDLQPHEMSPQEFIDHPDTLFHGSSGTVIEGLQKPASIHDDWIQDAIEDSRRLDPRDLANSVQTHVGSEIAAHDMSDGGPWHIHAVYADPKKMYGDVVSQEDANDIGDVEDYEDTIEASNLYYYNDHQDSAHLSAALSTTGPLTHADYVKQALEQGKGDEIHPETLKRYQEGTLSSIVKSYSSEESKDLSKVPEYKTAMEHGGGLFPKVLVPESKNEERVFPSVGTKKDVTKWQKEHGGEIYNAKDYYTSYDSLLTPGREWRKSPEIDAKRLHEMYSFGKPKRVYNQGEHPFDEPTMELFPHRDTDEY